MESTIANRHSTINWAITNREFGNITLLPLASYNRHMALCPHCHSVELDANGRCPQCGSDVASEAVTRFVDPDATTLSPYGTGETETIRANRTPPNDARPQPDGLRRAESRASGWLSSSDAISHGRFAPGVIFADRYRIVGLLGTGGMGEVYRADDLKLGQPVALKLLPPSVDDNPARLAQLHNEVRLARQVSHNSVCRVYDTGEANGLHFITMEYVDGEDLASLLRRIGRLPVDKALETARQICAGLAAAHERGVLHRDLKPANIMIDGQGKARITDFGLAGMTGDIRELRAGTPAYMAPEQLAGREVTIRSDIFALGLVLYETFTGRRAFDAKTIGDLVRMHDDLDIPLPSSLISDLDPAIDRAILRCLQREPSARPASALTVAAALPGGDPLAAALAAGETPSPEMVAAAGATSAMKPKPAFVTLTLIALGLFAFPIVGNTIEMTARIPFDKSPDVLLDRARTIVEQLGYGRPAHDAAGFAAPGEYVRHVFETRQDSERWLALATGRVPVVVWWYRSSPRLLAPVGSNTIVTTADPPFTVSGMMTTVLDTEGRLVEFNALPPQRDDNTSVAPPTDWRPLFDAAQLPLDRFASTAPTWTPRGYADQRAAWQGTINELPGVMLRVEAASYRGRPVFFGVIGPWEQPSRMEQVPQSASARAFVALTAVVFVALFLSAIVLARANLRRGRGDRAGALKLALTVLGLSLATWALTAAHQADGLIEVDLFLTGCRQATFTAGLLWLLYLALEPPVRRFWPDGLISWTRLLTGRFRDPLVGRDLLIGSAFGVLTALLTSLQPLTPQALGYAPAVPQVSPLLSLMGFRYLLAESLDALVEGIIHAMMLVFAFVMLRRLLKNNVIAAITVAILVPLAFSPNVAVRLLELALTYSFAVIAAMLLVVAMLKFGLLAAVAGAYVSLLLNQVPITSHAASWHGPAAMWPLVLTGALALYGLYCARAGEPLLGKELFAD